MGLDREGLGVFGRRRKYGSVLTEEEIWQYLD